MVRLWLGLGIAVVVGLALQVSKLSAFDSPVEQPAPVRPTAPACAPECERVELDANFTHEQTSPKPERVEPTRLERVEWSLPAWDPLDVDYQVGPDD